MQGVACATFHNFDTPSSHPQNFKSRVSTQRVQFASCRGSLGIYNNPTSLATKPILLMEKKVKKVPTIKEPRITLNLPGALIQKPLSEMKSHIG